MIPLRLQLKNFLSYGSNLQEIDFERYNLICLSGKNGHGKSAILDAITWALWGQARKVTTSVKADAGLLHLGQSHMLVVLDFALGDTSYRVRREFTQTQKKAYVTLEFGLLDEQTNRFIPLTEKTIRDTQQKIDRTIRIDYNAFSNSAFLRQGNADEFSRKSPKDRKEIIATILGLDQYDTIRKRAMEQAREAAVKKQTLCALNERITADLAKAEEVAHKKNELEKKLAETSRAEKMLATTRTALEKEQEALRSQQKELELLQFKQEQYHKQEEELRTQLQTVRASWRATHAKKCRLSTTDDPHEKRKKLVGYIERYQTAFYASLEQKEKLLKAREQLAKAEESVRTIHAHELQKAQLDAERHTQESQAIKKLLEELQKQKDAVDREEKTVNASLKEHEIRSKKDAALLNQHKKEQITFERRREYYQRFVAQGNLLNSEYKELIQRETLIGESDEPRCPLCEQNLSASRRIFLKKKSAQRISLVRHQLARMSKVITKLKTELIAQHEQIKKIEQLQQTHAARGATLEEQRKQQERVQATTKKFASQITDAEKNDAAYKCEITKKQAAVTALQESLKKRLLTDSASANARAQAKEYEAKLATLTYDAKAHEKVREQLKLVEEAIADQATLQEQLARQPERLAEVGRLCTRLRQFKRDKETTAQQLSDLKKSIHKNHVQFTEMSAEFNQSLKMLATEKEHLMQESGTLSALEKNFAQLRKDLETQQKQIATLDETINDYGIIATATGKDGIQALLIEETIPEVEQEANELLAKLTDNQTQLFIESLRDLKKGGTKETLDIKISDPAGIRPYELFSGGEAFRIDFALRIAISKLLARRAGTALQTLVIDEGFGSQDEEGLSRIMDAIHKIQDEFAKVIIVSHLDALKDQFPVHFVVTKSAGCSTVTIVEHG